MKNNTKTQNTILAAVLVASLTLGCSLLSNLLLPGSTQNGDDSFSNPLIGLQDMDSYLAEFQQEVVGTLDGQPYEKRTTLVLNNSGGQVDFTRGLSGTEDPASYFRLITSSQAVYRWVSQDLGCQGEAGQPSEGEYLNPASLLPALTGATRVGSETVNQVPAVHYTFTQADMKIADPKPVANGEIWIAEQGGFIVKYLLSIQPVSDPGEEQLKASQEWSYELSQVNALAEIILPDDCMAVPLDLPTMQDALEIDLSSGLLSYITNSTANEVVDFYKQNLPGLGWTTDNKLPAGELTLPIVFTFKNGQDRLSLNIDSSDQAGLDVDLAIYRPGAALPISTPEVPAPPEPSAIAPTVDAQLSGLPDDIPLYPGVTNLVNMDGTLSLVSTDAVAAIVAFYEQQMPGLGWTLFQKTDSDGAFILVWQKGERFVNIMVTPTDDVTFLVIAQQ
jgi:hypothetical protein